MLYQLSYTPILNCDTYDFRETVFLIKVMVDQQFRLEKVSGGDFFTRKSLPQNASFKRSVMREENFYKKYALASTKP
ncbi:MAG: hypothetical protein II377_06595 [Clostridia bacterium]|nr:hypothetical protein [Clostridia bacterium]